MAVSNNRILEDCQKLPQMQCLKVGIEWGHNFRHKNNVFIGQQPFCNFRHKNNIFISEQPKTMLNLTSDPNEG